MKESKFNWVALFFAPMYYAGYGKIGKGLLFALIGFVPITAIPVNIYAAFKANSELPVGENPFSWWKAAIAFALMAIIRIVWRSLQLAALHGGS